jgi:N6-L-threonylcarbamoyladenine synthase
MADLSSPPPLSTPVPILVLAIESTCDETGAAVVRNGAEVLSNVVSSSAPLHEQYGGVFPEVASRRHMEVIAPVVKEALAQAAVSQDQIDLIAVAQGPGLIGSLLVGLNFAKGLSIGWGKPLIGVNHVEAHLYAAWMENPAIELPALGVVLSGGHTLLLHIEAPGRHLLIGTTVDDAIGEAFDKVGSLLDLPYPAGAPLEQLARSGDPRRFPLQAGTVKRGRCFFSFSGLKTACLYALPPDPTPQDRADLAASFQEAAFRDVAKKIGAAREERPYRSLVFGGGVCNNRRLRALIRDSHPDHPANFPPPALTLDNAAMIGGLGALLFLQRGKGDPLTLSPFSRMAYSPTLAPGITVVTGSLGTSSLLTATIV